MNCMSLNIRGMGEKDKLEWVRRLKTSQKLHFIGIQETQIADFSNIKIIDCWDDDNFDYDFVNATGRSGGLVCIWDRS